MKHESKVKESKNFPKEKLKGKKKKVFEDLFEY